MSNYTHLSNKLHLVKICLCCFFDMHLYSYSLSSIAKISFLIKLELLPACFCCSNNFNLSESSSGSDGKNIVFEIPEAEIIKLCDLGKEKDFFENIIISSKRSPKLLEGDRDGGFYNSIFRSFLNNNNFKLYSRNPSFGSVLAERYNRTIRDLPERAVVEKGDGNWIDILQSMTKQYNNRVHNSTRLTPIKGGLKKNGGFVYKILLGKRKRNKPKFQVNDLVITADLKTTFSKGDTTNWSYKWYRITEFVNEIIPSYRIDILPDCYNEALLRKKDVTMKENDSVMKKLNRN